MLMYALLNNLLTKIDEALSSLRLNTEAKKVVVIVYANDWNITLTTRQVFLYYTTFYTLMNKLQLHDKEE